MTRFIAHEKVAGFIGLILVSCGDLQVVAILTFSFAVDMLLFALPWLQDVGFLRRVRLEKKNIIRMGLFISKLSPKHNRRERRKY